MADGVVASIHIADSPSGPTRPVPEILAVAGRGLEGDRYFAGTGSWSDHPGGGREVTLIESEAIEALERDHGVSIDPGDARRNIVTQGVALNHLVGRGFAVGEVRLRGLRLCEPCGHLEKLTRRGVREGLVHRGGLRAEIVAGGMIRPGDPIRPDSEPGPPG
jgi:MOSC domain-containing protein YiiM